MSAGRICVSLPVHTRPPIVAGQLANFAAFLPEARVVLHVSANARFALAQLDATLHAAGCANAAINPARLPTGWGDILPAHLANIAWIRRHVPHCTRICLHSSNDMLVRPGLAHHLGRGRNFLQRRPLRPGSRWRFTVAALTDPALGALRAHLGGAAAIGSQVEGSSYEAALLYAIADLAEPAARQAPALPYPREEVWLSTLAHALLADAAPDGCGAPAGAADAGRAGACASGADDADDAVHVADTADAAETSAGPATPQACGASTGATASVAALDGTPYVFSEVHRFDRAFWQVLDVADPLLGRRGDARWPPRRALEFLMIRSGFHRIDRALVERIVRNRPADADALARWEWLSDGADRWRVFERHGLYGVKRVPRRTEAPLRRYIDRLGAVAPGYAAAPAWGSAPAAMSGAASGAGLPGMHGAAADVAPPSPPHAHPP